MRRSAKKYGIPLTIALLFLSVSAIIQYRNTFCAEPVAAAVAELHTLVIDPGHGGLDGGASAADGTTESSINLAISLRLRDLCSLCGVPCKITRTDETLEYPAELDTIHAKKVWDQQHRLDLSRSVSNPVFLSVHQNYYPDTRPSGIQVLYAASAGSEQLGAIAQDNLLRCLCPECRRVLMPAGTSIFLMKQMQCPAILVECGFLSNPDEAKTLQTSAYQTKLAAVLLVSYLQYESALTAI